jgi:hypothetical protein
MTCRFTTEFWRYGLAGWIGPLSATHYKRRRAAELEQQPAEGIRRHRERRPPAESSAPRQLRREPPARGLTLEVGVVLSAEHSVCLVHVALPSLSSMCIETDGHALCGPNAPLRRLSDSAFSPA